MPPVTIPVPIHGVHGTAGPASCGGLCCRAPQGQVLGWGMPRDGDANSGCLLPAVTRGQASPQGHRAGAGVCPPPVPPGTLMPCPGAPTRHQLGDTCDIPIPNPGTLMSHPPVSPGAAGTGSPLGGGSGRPVFADGHPARAGSLLGGGLSVLTAGWGEAALRRHLHFAEDEEILPAGDDDGDIATRQPVAADSGGGARTGLQDGPAATGREPSWLQPAGDSCAGVGDLTGDPTHTGLRLPWSARESPTWTWAPRRLSQQQSRRLVMVTA